VQQGLTDEVSGLVRDQLAKAPAQTLAGGFLLEGPGGCPAGSRRWQTIYLVTNNLLGSPGSTSLKASALCLIG
jgi:hypothetical protein